MDKRERTQMLVVIAVLMLLLIVLLISIFVRADPHGGVSDEHRAVPVSVTGHPNHGHFVDPTCMVQRRHGRWDGSCQTHYKAWVTDTHRACRACHGKAGDPPCRFHPGVVCTALLHADLYSWGDTYSIHELVRFYYDGYHTWANRTFKGWHGWQKCWSGYAVGVDITDLECGSRFAYRWDGTYRLQATDWFYRYKASLFAKWFPVSKTWEINGQHWPYPSDAEVWMS